MAFNNENIVYLEDKDFTSNGDLKIDTMKPVLIMIYGNGCPHCHHAMPELVKLSRERADLAMYTCIETDGSNADSHLLERLSSFIPNLQGIPTFLLYKNGRFIKTFQGARKAAELEKFIES